MPGSTAGSSGPLRSGSGVAPLMEGAGTALPTRPDATSSLLGQGSEPPGVLLTLQVTRPTAHLLSQLLPCSLPVELSTRSPTHAPPGPHGWCLSPSQGTWALSCLQGLLSGSALARCQCCCPSPHLTLEGHLSDTFALDSVTCCLCTLASRLWPGAAAASRPSSKSGCWWKVSPKSGICLRRRQMP